MAYPEEKRAGTMATHRHDEASLKSVTAASIVYQQLECIVARATSLADRSENALSSVTRASVPRETNNQIGRAEEWMPALFDNVRGHANQIETALRRIEDVLDRLEL